MMLPVRVSEFSSKERTKKSDYYHPTMNIAEFSGENNAHAIDLLVLGDRSHISHISRLSFILSAEFASFFHDDESKCLNAFLQNQLSKSSEKTSRNLSVMHYFMCREYSKMEVKVATYSVWQINRYRTLFTDESQWNRTQI